MLILVLVSYASFHHCAIYYACTHNDQTSSLTSASPYVLFDQRLRTGTHRMHRQRAQQASYFQKMVILITLWRQAVAARQLASNPPRAQRSRTGMRVSRQIIVLRIWPAILARMMKLVASQGRVAAQARLARRRMSAWPTTTDVAFASQVLATAIQVTLKTILLICSS